MLKRFLAVVLCVLLCVSLLPVISFADNSGFLQIRIYYKTKDSLGNWSTEKSAIITDNSAISIPTNNMLVPLQITRIFFSNTSDSTCYFQFDLNFGGMIPREGGYPLATYDSNIINFSTSGGVQAFGFPSTDKTPFSFIEHPEGIDITVINTTSNRTFFGKVNASGYLNFNNPVNITFRQNDSPTSNLYMFFRHLIIGLDSSSYLANMEQYLNSIDSNVGSIANWMEEEHNQFQSSWNNGAGSAYSDYSSDNGTFFSNILGILGLRIFSWHWDLNIFNASNNFFSSWFSQSNSDNINGTPRRSTEETEYIDYYSRNQSGDLNIFGVDSND